MPPSEPHNTDPASAPRPISAIARFLGPDVEEQGPFVLMGLDPAAHEQADRLVPPLLEARLMRVNGHPQARTPEADQVRLAVHAAAAQLLNPKTRLAQLRYWHPEHAPVEVVPQLSPAGDAQPNPINDEARRVMAMHGGWNRDSMLALASMSRDTGASIQQLAQVASSAGSPVAAPAPTRRSELAESVAAAEATAKPVLSEQVDPAYRKMQTGVRIAGIGCGTIVLVSIIGFAATRCESTKVPANPVAKQQQVPAPAVREQDRAPLPGTLFAADGERLPKPATTDGAVATVAKSGVTDATALLTQVREIRSVGATDPAAASRQLALAVEQAGSAWATWQPDQIAAFTDGVVDAVYALSRDADWGRGAIDAIMAPTVWRQPVDAREVAPRVWPSVFASGALARLSRERDLPTAVRSAVNIELTRVSATPSDATFEAGARSGLQAVASNLSAVRGSTSSTTDLGAAWGKWADAALATADMSGSGDVSRRSLVLLVPFEDFLRTGPDPSADKQAFESIQAITSRLDFSTAGPPRQWLLRWLISPEITAGRLFALTARLAQEPAESGGVDTSLVVPAAAHENLRADLRDRYAKAWGMVDSQDADALKGDWVAWTKEFLADASVPQSPAMALAGAVAAARINEAAWLMWTGEPERASFALDRRIEPAAMVQKALEAVKPNSILDPGPPDGEWGAKYLVASVNEKREMLNAVGSGAEVVGPRDCFVIVNEMIRGQSVPLRAGARDRVRFLSGQAPMLATLLDLVGTLPRTRETNELLDFVTIQTMPSTDDPRWREYARRALVERLLTAIAAGGEFGVVDTLAEQMGEAYQVRSGVVATGTVQNPEEAAHRLATRMMKVAETLPATGREHATLTEISQRWTARQQREKASSTGKIRVFLAHQMTCLELTAYTMVTEDPTREARVKEVVSRVSQVWSGANSSMEQARIAERGICELWLLRLAPIQEGAPK
ncbi:MAG: hypothetical protein KGS45_07655 [Planctomycetes bacterium]|nr:hypothetical protein [Planctomycetota bacterium]